MKRYRKVSIHVRFKRGQKVLHLTGLYTYNVHIIGQKVLLEKVYIFPSSKEVLKYHSFRNIKLYKERSFKFEQK